jgi:hypothetical protein
MLSSSTSERRKCIATSVVPLRRIRDRPSVATQSLRSPIDGDGHSSLMPRISMELPNQNIPSLTSDEIQSKFLDIRPVDRMDVCKRCRSMAQKRHNKITFCSRLSH